MNQSGTLLFSKASAMDKAVSGNIDVIKASVPPPFPRLPLRADLEWKSSKDLLASVGKEMFIVIKRKREKEYFNNTFCVVFVYPRKGAPFMIKGPYTECQRWIDKYGKPCVAHWLQHWGARGFLKRRVGYSPHVENMPRPFHATISKHSSSSLDLSYGVPKGTHKHGGWLLTVWGRQQSYDYMKVFRYPPRCWIKELDKVIAASPQVAP